MYAHNNFQIQHEIERAISALTVVSTAVIQIDFEISLTVQNVLQFYN